MTTPTRPHFIVFMLDTQRADNLSCYGYDKPTSPNIDRLAEEGAVFLDNVSPAIWTLPAVASLMTGLHVHSHGAGASYEAPPAVGPTLAETLAPMGYRTGAFFGNRYGAFSQRGFRSIDIPTGNANAVGPNTYGMSRGRVEDACRWLEKNAVDDEQPCFLYIQVMDPHMPLHPVSPYRERFMSESAKRKGLTEFRPDVNGIHLGKTEMSEEELAMVRSLYDAETAGADSHVGLMMDFLREKDLIDRTAVFVMSDHGECFGEHRKIDGTIHFAHHLCCYDELIRVPLVARFPEAIPSGTRVTHTTQTHDIFATVAELAGFEAPQCQAFSLLPAVQGKPERDFALTEYQRTVHMAGRLVGMDEDYDPRLHMRWLKAWRQDGHKYIWASDLRDELYDIENDPGETKNLIEDEPERALKMRKALTSYMASLPHAEVGDYLLPNKSPEAALDRLRGMEWFRPQPAPPTVWNI